MKAMEFTPPLSMFIMATTGTRDATVQEVIRLLSAEHQRKGLFKVDVMFWDDLVNLYDRHRDVFRSHYNGLTRHLKNIQNNDRPCQPTAGGEIGQRTHLVLTNAVMSKMRLEDGREAWFKDESRFPFLMEGIVSIGICDVAVPSWAPLAEEVPKLAPAFRRMVKLIDEEGEALSRSLSE
jgi:hypothetical protein